MLTQDEFWAKHTKFGLRMCVLEGGLTCILLGLITIVTMGVIGLVDGLLNIALGWGVCRKRSRACAVAAGIYYAISQMFARFVMGQLLDVSGMQIFIYFIIALMILSIYGTFTFQSRYKEYTQTAGDTNAPPAP